MIHLCARVSEALFEGKSPTSVISPLNTSICISEAQGRFLTPSQCSHRLAKVTVVFWYHRIPSSYSDLSVSACLFWTVVIFGSRAKEPNKSHMCGRCASQSRVAPLPIWGTLSLSSLCFTVELVGLAYRTSSFRIRVPASSQWGGSFHPVHVLQQGHLGSFRFNFWQAYAKESGGFFHSSCISLTPPFCFLSQQILKTCF